MSAQPALHARSPSEIKAIIEAERIGVPFLLWRDGSGLQRIESLGGRERATLGRGSSCDVVLSDDGQVSRTHAELERVGDEWAIVDDGLSRNGTFVGGVRISGRRRLADGDVVRLGGTIVEYRCPGEPSVAATSAATKPVSLQDLTVNQQKILTALCRPYKSSTGYAAPASNSDIADEVFLSIDAVKNNLRVLFQRFEIADLPQNQKRARLVECAFEWGLVSERDL